MTTKIGGIVIDIDARLARLEKSLAKGQGDLRRFEKNTMTTAKAVESHVNKMSTAFKGFIGIVATRYAIGAVKGLADLSDQAKLIDSQLKLATASSGSFAQAQADVSRIARVTRGDLSATAKLYGNLVRASEALGKDQTQAARATETFAKALKIGGAGTAEAASATLQFGQALASGVLRGDEFNSIAEASPRIMRLLADSLGVSTGALRAMAAEGELTADKLYKALTEKKFTDGIDSEFKNIPVTFGDAMQSISNQATISFGAFDRGGEFSKALVNFTMDGVSGFDDLAKRAEEFGINTRAHIEGLASAFDPLYEAGKSFFDWLSQYSATSNITIGIDTQKSLDQIDKETKWLSQQGMLGALLTGNDPMSDPASRQGTNFGGRYRGASTESARSRRSDLAFEKFQDRWGFKGDSIYMTPNKPASVTLPPGKKDKPAKEVKDPIAEMMKSVDIDIRNTAIEFADEVTERYAKGIVTAEEGWQKVLDVRREEEEDLARFQDRQVQNLAGLYESAFHGGTKAIWDDFKNIGLRVISEVLAKFTLANISGNGGGFNFGSALSSAFGSVLGFAGGGRPPLGRASIIGENGPELWKPDQAGTIIPNHMLGVNDNVAGGGGGGTVIPITINAPGATAETVSMIRREMMIWGPKIAEAAQAATLRTMTRPALGR